MSDNVVAWVLEAIKDNWPGSYPTDVYRINRDDPLILETDERTRSLELSQASAIGASRGNKSEEAIGVSYNFRVEQPVHIRIEGLHEREHGTIESDGAFSDLVADVREALKRERKHPSIDGGDVNYQTISFESSDSMSAENRDYYRTDLTIVLSGYEVRDD